MPTPIRRNTNPIVLDCLPSGLILNPKRPNWIFQEFVSPVSWSACPVLPNFKYIKAIHKTTFDSCREFTITKIEDVKYKEYLPRNVRSMKPWTTNVNREGQLTIFDIQFNNTDPEHWKSYALMCYTKKNDVVSPINTYFTERQSDKIKLGVVFDGRLEKYRLPLRAISPKDQNMEIFARKVRTIRLFYYYQLNLDYFRDIPMMNTSQYPYMYCTGRPRVPRSNGLITVSLSTMGPTSQWTNTALPSTGISHRTRPAYTSSQ